MLTFEKVLEIFDEYLKEDLKCEVIKTRHGYIVAIWDNTHRNYEFVDYCDTPDELKAQLLDEIESYNIYKFTLAKREKLKPNERKFIDNELAEILAKFEE